MPPIKQDSLPGVLGKDYTLVRYGGKIYVVYQVKLPNGRMIRMSWKIEKGDMKGFGINPDKIRGISADAFRRLNYFGSARDISGGAPGEHPFQTYLKKLADINGHVSWLKNPEFVATMLMGFAEGWSQTEIQQKLTTTQWYQTRNESQRNWEMNLSKGDRKAAIQSTMTGMQEILRELYGPDADISQIYTNKALQDLALKVASGKYGTPEEGLQIWSQQERDKAEKIEGSPAWISRETEVESQREFLNRPENMYTRLRQEAEEFLGPHGMPDNQTLKQWAADIVTEKSSEGDWDNYLRQQRRSLYPYIGSDVGWQDFASPYRRMAEDTWGRPIKWGDNILRDLGGQATDGSPTGQAMLFQDFETKLRSQNEFWQGPVARQEGYDLLQYLNSTFSGVS